MQPISHLPALADSARARYVLLVALYFAEGLNMGLLFVAIPAWLAAQGKTPAEIGSFAVACALPWTFKFVVAPLMDRYAYLPMGRKKPWVLLSQLGLAASLLLLAAVPAPLRHLALLNAAGFLASAFGAIQDAATDAMAVDLVPTAEQARANGLMGGGRMIGSSLALTASSWALSTSGLGAAAGLLAALIGLATLVPLALREQPGEKLAPWLAGAPARATSQQQVTDWATVVRSLLRAFSVRGSLLVALLVLLTQGAYNYFETLLPLFAVQQTGWTNVYYSHVFATADLTGGVVGMLLGGFLIERFGKKRMIGLYLLLIVAIILALTTLRSYWASTVFLYGLVVLYRWLNAFAKIGVYAIAMECSSKLISASQFTLYMTMGAVGSLAGAALIAPLKEHLAWQGTFLAFAAMLGLAGLVLYALNIRRQVAQMTQLDEAGSEAQMRPVVY